jgi:hypothetical protein
MPQLPGQRPHRTRRRRRLIPYLRRVLTTGAAASAASALAATLCSRLENRHGARPINAVAHIYDGGRPPAGEGRAARNTALGFAIHTGASWWWALFYEALSEKHRNLAGAAGVAAAAYIVDYHVVGERFRPGFEAHLSGRAVLATYLALAAGFALGSALDRRLHHHEEKYRDEGDERRPAKRRPDRVVAPETRRQRLA